MGHRYWTGVCAAVGLLAASLGAQPAVAADLCVGGPKPGCFATLQAAIGAAQHGDTIKLAPGTYAGGITIAKNVELIGTSPASTVIRGGGPVVTVGDGVSKPTVSISRVTITGGLNDSTGVAAGGGVAIPPLAAGNATGATVSISDSVISGNRAAPSATFPGPTPCGSVPFDQCAFALGGGVDNSGTLTLTDTRVTDNVAGSAGVTSSAAGGGIDNHPQGTLTLVRSSVTGNRAAVSSPFGRFAEGGGMLSSGTLSIEDSVVDRNSVDASTAVASSFPADVQQEAVAGGIRLEAGAVARITRTSISDNVVTSSNLGGDAQAVAGGMDVDGTLLLVDSRVDRNSVTATVAPASGFLAGAVFGGLEVQGTATIRRSSISHNVMAAASATGAVNVAGGGIGNLSAHVTLERTLLVGNRGTASGPFGLAIGGAIVNIDFVGGPPELAVSDSVVTANRLEAAPGITPQGGGIFSANIFSGDPIAFTLTRTVIAGNKPDQCVGC